MEPLVSILIPLYNAERWIEETLRSALGQTWSNTEIIVVDDGSTDNSLKIARSFQSQGVTLLTQDNRGACTARNRAFTASNGELIQYLDADDLMAPDKIEIQVRRLCEEPPRSIANARWHPFETEVDEAPQASSSEDCEDPLEWLLAWTRGDGGTRPHAWLTPRSVIRDAGPWREDLRVNQDGEFFSRVLLESQKIAFCPDARVFYRTGNDGVSARQDRASWESLYETIDLMTKRILEEKEIPRTQRACATKWRHFQYNAYPSHPDLANAAEEKVADLGISDYTHGSTLYQATEKLLGWKAARWLQYGYRRIVYG